MSKKRINWFTVIPTLFWIVLIIASTIKRVLVSKVTLYDFIDIFNGNTFSTYIVMVIVMSYHFYSTNSNNVESSGLSRKWMPLTIIFTIIYWTLFIIDVFVNYSKIPTIVLFVFSIIYVIVFFKLMKVHK